MASVCCDWMKEGVASSEQNRSDESKGNPWLASVSMLLKNCREDERRLSIFYSSIPPQQTRNSSASCNCMASWQNAVTTSGGRDISTAAVGSHVITCRLSRSVG